MVPLQQLAELDRMRQVDYRVRRAVVAGPQYERRERILRVQVETVAGRGVSYQRVGRRRKVGQVAGLSGRQEFLQRRVSHVDALAARVSSWLGNEMKTRVAAHSHHGQRGVDGAPPPPAQGSQDLIALGGE